MLEEFFHPKSVAVIGASTSPGKLGYAVLENLVEGPFHQGEAEVIRLWVDKYNRNRVWI